MTDQIDEHLGRVLRRRRRGLRMSLYDLGAIVGVSFQQIHKYEQGISRMSAGRLYAITRALGLSMSECFDGYRALQDASADASVSRPH